MSQHDGPFDFTIHLEQWENGFTIHAPHGSQARRDEDAIAAGARARMKEADRLTGLAAVRFLAQLDEIGACAEPENGQ